MGDGGGGCTGPNGTLATSGVLGYLHSLLHSTLSLSPKGLSVRKGEDKGVGRMSRGHGLPHGKNRVRS